MVQSQDCSPFGWNGACIGSVKLRASRSKYFNLDREGQSETDERGYSDKKRKDAEPLVFPRLVEVGGACELNWEWDF